MNAREFLISRRRARKDTSKVTSSNMVVLFEVVELLREHDPEMSAQLLSTFLHIASHEGATKQQTEESIGLSTTSGSRNTGYLGKKQLNRDSLKQPLELVQQGHPEDNQRKLVHTLSPKGQLLVAQIELLLANINKETE